ncbi:MAG TPA: tetratricopeptide repeat protein, partial [Vicinamibacteria bacterium]|nr:tetratricopeptide repeat protein [Vicinamibacteria bacterium]
MTRVIAVALTVSLAGAASLGAGATAPVEVGGQAHREALEHYHAGESFFYAEDWTQAAREFRAAIGLDPLLVLAHYSLGQTYMSAKEYPSAVRAFTGARDAYLKVAALAATDQVKSDQQRVDEIRELQDGIRLIRSQATQMAARGSQPENAILKLEARIRDLETFKQKGAGVVEVPAEF